MRRVRKTRRKNDLKKIKTAFLLSGLMVISISIFSSNYMMNEKLEKYKQKETEVTQKLEDEQRRTQEIAEYEKYTETKSYVEDVARERLHLFYPDEVVFMEKD